MDAASEVACCGNTDFVAGGVPFWPRTTFVKCLMLCEEGVTAAGVDLTFVPAIFEEFIVLPFEAVVTDIAGKTDDAKPDDSR